MLSDEVRGRVMVALDCEEERALELGRSLVGHATWVKVGMTLFYRSGPGIVSSLSGLGFEVFLDLKLHDIPHQVRGAARSAAACGADMLTVHTVGGVPMMEAALEGAREGAVGATPLVIGVTVLTSMDRSGLTSIGVVEGEVAGQVSRLAVLAREAGLDGVVASPLEVRSLRGLLGADACIVTPGIRPAGAAVGDQSRIATPVSAIRAGASHLVIGRPITQAADPVAAFEAIVAEISGDGDGDGRAVGA